jgi:hypothetical protein
MPKYLLPKHSRGGPEPLPRMDQWACAAGRRRRRPDRGTSRTSGGIVTTTTRRPR